MRGGAEEVERVEGFGFSNRMDVSEVPEVRVSEDETLSKMYMIWVRF